MLPSAFLQKFESSVAGLAGGFEQGSVRQASSLLPNFDQPPSERQLLVLYGFFAYCNASRGNPIDISVELARFLDQTSIRLRSWKSYACMVYLTDRSG
jgi:hypothetical protein